MNIRTPIFILLCSLLPIQVYAFPPAPYFRIYGNVRSEQGHPLGDGEGIIILSGIHSALNTATVSGGSITGVNVVNSGSYTSAPNLTFIGSNGTGNGAAGTAVLTDGVVTGVTMTNAGSGYVAPVSVTFSGGGGTPVEIVRSISSPSNGTNYSLSVPMDSGTITQLNDLSALRPWFPFSIKVVVGGVSYVPIQIAGATSPFWISEINKVNSPDINTQGNHWAVGQPSDKLRLDLTLGVDSDNDGLPDAWEEGLVSTLGLDSIADVLPDDDSDGDGVSNFIEYIAGTYAFDKSDTFGLEFVEVITTGVSPEEENFAHLQFLSIPGRTYKIREWTGHGPMIPREFSLTSNGEGLRSSLIASEVEEMDVYVPMENKESRFFVLFVE